MGVCVLQVTLAYESIVLYMCEGKVLMDILFLEMCDIFFAYWLTRANVCKSVELLEVQLVYITVVFR